jgi:hypothetical protein
MQLFEIWTDIIGKSFQIACWNCVYLPTTTTTDAVVAIANELACDRCP